MRDIEREALRRDALAALRLRARNRKMKTADTCVRARIGTAAKERATDTLAAIAELESGRGKRSKGVDEPLADLKADH
jgi:hypothetical protein